MYYYTKKKLNYKASDRKKSCKYPPKNKTMLKILMYLGASVMDQNNIQENIFTENIISYFLFQKHPTIVWLKLKYFRIKIKQNCMIFNFSIKNEINR